MKNISFRTDVLPLKNGLYRLALRITLNPAEAEDIVQDTLIKVWNKRDDWPTIDSIEAFSYTICRNLALDSLKRREGHHESLEDEGQPVPTTASTPFERTAEQDRMRLVRTLVDHLPEKQRACLQLRDFEGKSYKEVAALLGITEEQVKVSIFRARQTIKQRYQKLEEYGL